MSEDGGHSGKIPHTWSNYLVDAPRPDTYERILAASALPGELILSEYERKRLNNATAAKDGEARATDQELVAAYRELPPSDLLDRINTAAHERIVATAQYHCQQRLWRSALLAAGVLAQELTRECLRRQANGEPVFVPLNQSYARMMTQPVAIDSDEEFKGKRKGKKGAVPMRLAPAPAPGRRPPQPLPGRLPVVIDADDIPLSTLQLMRKTYGRAPRPPPPDLTQQTSASVTAEHQHGEPNEGLSSLGTRTTPKRKSAVVATQRIAGQAGAADATEGSVRKSRRNVATEEQGGREAASQSDGCRKAHRGRKGLRTRRHARSESLDDGGGSFGTPGAQGGADGDGSDDLEGNNRGAGDDDVQSDEQEAGGHEGSGGEAGRQLLRLPAPPDPNKIVIDKSLLAYATWPTIIVPNRRWKFVIFPRSARRKCTRKAVPQPGMSAAIELPVCRAVVQPKPKRTKKTKAATDTDTDGTKQKSKRRKDTVPEYVWPRPGSQPKQLLPKLPAYAVRPAYPNTRGARPVSLGGPFRSTPQAALPHWPMLRSAGSFALGAPRALVALPPAQRSSNTSFVSSEPVATHHRGSDAGEDDSSDASDQ